MGQLGIMRPTSQEAATLLDILIDGLEILGGFHRRELPMPDEAAALDSSLRCRKRPALEGATRATTGRGDTAARGVVGSGDLTGRTKCDGAGSRARVRRVVARSADVGKAIRSRPRTRGFARIVTRGRRHGQRRLAAWRARDEPVFDAGEIEEYTDHRFPGGDYLFNIVPERDRPRRYVPSAVTGAGASRASAGAAPRFAR
jgi:hypothetical protein